MATINCCDVCKDVFPGVGPGFALTRIMARINLEGLHDPSLAEKNYVVLEMDLCPKPACRKKGVFQATQELRDRALERIAGMDVTPVDKRE